MPRARVLERLGERSRGAHGGGVGEEQLGDAAREAEHPQVDDAPRERLQVRPAARRASPSRPGLYGHGKGHAWDVALELERHRALHLDDLHVEARCGEVGEQAALEGEVHEVRRGADEGDRVGVGGVAEREAAQPRVGGLGREEGERRVWVAEEAAGEALECRGGLLEEEDRVRGGGEGEHGCVLALEVDLRGHEPGAERPDELAAPRAGVDDQERLHGAQGGEEGEEVWVRHEDLLADEREAF